MENFANIHKTAAAATSVYPSYQPNDAVYVVYSGLPSQYGNIQLVDLDQRRAIEYCQDELAFYCDYLWTPDPAKAEMQADDEIVEIHGPIDDPELAFTVVRYMSSIVSAALRTALLSEDTVVEWVYVLYNRDGLNIWNLCMSEDEARGFREMYYPFYHGNAIVKSLPFLDW
ncbi:MAG: hypothetical protein Q9172_003995 [Xanthocarpia lactea]